MSVKQLHIILEYAIQHGASDIHLKAERKPHFRKDGRLLTHEKFGDIPAHFLTELMQTLASEKERACLEQERNLDIAYHAPEIGRFRLNVFFQMDRLGIVFRYVPTIIPTLKELHLPTVVGDMALQLRGLVLVTGATGCGKTTTVAAMIRHINEHREAHIITLEDPVEFLHSDITSMVNQRQVGTDVRDFGTALRAALRQDPDVIVVGEMRDMETMYTALRAAETGHLVLSTLHTLDAKETLLRILHMCPPREQHGLRHLLASTLSGVVSQRLLSCAMDSKRIPAVEVMKATPRIRDLITQVDGHLEIRQAISEGRSAYGMQTFDQSLLCLYQDGLIEFDEAMANATSPDDFRLLTSGIRSSTTM
jgi:twitching motility protein PilT